MYGNVGLPDISSPYKSRYENLEKSMNELKMKQRKRRIRGAASASSRRRNFGLKKKRAAPASPASPGVRDKPGVFTRVRVFVCIQSILMPRISEYIITEPGDVSTSFQ